jgi:hypothetical protein
VKKLICTLIVSSLVSLTAPVLAAEAPNLKDQAPMVGLTVIEADISLLSLCGVTGDDAARYLESDNKKKATYEAQLSDSARAALPDVLANLDAGIKKSWDTTSADQRAKSCDALKARMAAGK